MKGIFATCLIFIVSVLAACGGSDGDDSGGNDNGIASGVNVALQSNGGTASTNYKGSMPENVNDGDTSTFWAGTGRFDYATVEFDQQYSINKVIIHTNATNNQDFVILYSSDGINGHSIEYLKDCKSASFGSGKVSCTLRSPVDATQVSVEIAASSGVSNIEIYEIVAET